MYYLLRYIQVIVRKELGIVSMEYVDIYCINHDLDRDRFVLERDQYAYHMMNIVDYLVGNTDRHWGRGQNYRLESDRRNIAGLVFGGRDPRYVFPKIDLA